MVLRASAASSATKSRPSFGLASNAFPRRGSGGRSQDDGAQTRRSTIGTAERNAPVSRLLYYCKRYTTGAERRNASQANLYRSAHLFINAPGIRSMRGQVTRISSHGGPPRAVATGAQPGERRVQRPSRSDSRNRRWETARYQVRTAPLSPRPRRADPPRSCGQGHGIVERPNAPPTYSERGNPDATTERPILHD